MHPKTCGDEQAHGERGGLHPSPNEDFRHWSSQHHCGTRKRLTSCKRSHDHSASMCGSGQLLQLLHEDEDQDAIWAKAKIAGKDTLVKRHLGFYNTIRYCHSTGKSPSRQESLPKQALRDTSWVLHAQNRQGTGVFGSRAVLAFLHSLF